MKPDIKAKLEAMAYSERMQYEGKPREICEQAFGAGFAEGYAEGVKEGKERTITLIQRMIMDGIITEASVKETMRKTAAALNPPAEGGEK